MATSSQSYDRRRRISAALRRLMPSGGHTWTVPVITLLLLLGLVAGAVIMSTVTRRHVQLDDGTVWVTSLKNQKAARFNVKNKEADAGVSSSAPRFDIAQHNGDTILTETTKASTIKASTVSTGVKTDIKANTTTVVGGDTAALYAARAGMDTVVLEKLSAGGQMALTEQIDNYPGFEDGIDGFSLGEKMKRGTERFGVETKLTEVLSLELSGSVKKAVTSEGAMYAKSIVLATGAGPRELGVDDEQELIGKGVHYCAACDGMFYRNKTVVIAGGGNTAAADALILSRICKKVIVVHRRGTLKATKIYHEPLMKTENVEFLWDSKIIALLHNEKLTGIQIRNVKTGEESTLACDGVFVSVGRKPSTELMKDQIEIDPAGYIIADESTRTNIPGVFAVGDVRTKALRQVVTAVADGATAVHYAEEYLAGEM